MIVATALTVERRVVASAFVSATLAKSSSAAIVPKPAKTAAKVVCKDCSETCNDCKEIFCKYCLINNGRCKSCYEKSKEESDAGTDEAEVHADGVGEVAVPT